MKLLAVTSCPTGIAHTYMAAEALQMAAEELGGTNQGRNLWLNWCRKRNN